MSRLREALSVRKLLTGLAVLLFLLCVFAWASADVKVKVTGGMGVFSKSGESYLRDSDGVPDGLGRDEFISFMVYVTNTSQTDQKYRTAYFRVDGGKKLVWANFSLKTGQTARCHIYNVNMEKLSAGMHELSDLRAERSGPRPEKVAVYRLLSSVQRCGRYYGIHH